MTKTKPATPYGRAADKAAAKAHTWRAQHPDQGRQVQALRPARLPPARAIEEVVGGLIRAHVTACDRCEGGHLFGEDDRGYSVTRECECAVLARQARRLTAAEVPAGTAIPTWETLGVNGVWSPAAAAAADLAEAIEAAGPDGPLPPGLVLAGPSGTGKTHTLGAIIRRLAIGQAGDHLQRRAARALAQLQRKHGGERHEGAHLVVPSVRFISWFEAMGQVRAAMDGNRSGIVVEALAAVPVLAIDELADAIGSDFEQRTLASLLVARDKAGCCTLVATNYHMGPAWLEAERGRPRRPDPNALASRLQPHIVSRLGSLVAVEVTGADRRLRGAQ